MESAAVVLKSDQEPSTLDLVNDIASRRAAVSKVEKITPEEKEPGPDRGSNLHPKSVPESAPRYSSASNGFNVESRP